MTMDGEMNTNSRSFFRIFEETLPIHTSIEYKEDSGEVHVEFIFADEKEVITITKPNEILVMEWVKKCMEFTLRPLSLEEQFRLEHYNRRIMSGEFNSQ